MHPDGLSRVPFPKPVGNPAEALAKPFTVLSIGRHGQQPVGQAKHQHHEQREGVEDERHGG